MGLDIIVVGAGIAGLTAAVSLRQHGHSVKIFEKSPFATEVGAALGVTPNGGRVLQSLGFSFDRARAVAVKNWNIVNGVNLDTINAMNLENSVKAFGIGTHVVHRVDLHNELLRLALDTARDTEPITLHLSSKITAASATEGWIEVNGNERHHADLIVGADGIHSILRPLVTRTDCSAMAKTDFSAFRFLIPTEVFQQHEDLAQLLKWKGPSAVTLTNPKDETPERHIMWYACRGGEVQNFVGIHRTKTPVDRAEDGSEPNHKVEMLEEFVAYHPALKHAIGLAENVSCWPLNIHEPLRNWVNGRMILIGDAAHPMLPFGGQGANQAIEDAGALGSVLDNLQDDSVLPERLAIFQRIRLNRAAMIQTLSSVRVGRELEIRDKLVEFALPGEKIPESFQERSVHAFGYDVLGHSRRALDSAA